LLKNDYCYAVSIAYEYGFVKSCDVELWGVMKGYEKVKGVKFTLFQRGGKSKSVMKSRR
jgi:hypothetical protein